MMHTSFGRTWLAIALVTLLAGCAAPVQERIALSQDFHSKSNGSIGVVMTALPSPDTFFPGADCLLCLATASMVNRSLTEAVRTWPTDDLKSLPEESVTLLRSKGHQAVLLSEPIKLDSLPDRPNAEPGFARKDFGKVRAKAGVDRLLVIDIQSIGAQRPYAAYIANGPAVARVIGQVYLIDLTTHRLEWYESFNHRASAQEAWEEPPRFPGLANAYFTAIENSKDSIKKPLGR